MKINNSLLLATLIFCISQTSINATSRPDNISGKAYTIKSGLIQGYLSGLIPVVGQLQLAAALRATPDTPKTAASNFKRGALLGHAAGIATLATAAHCTVRFILNRIETLALRLFCL